MKYKAKIINFEFTYSNILNQGDQPTILKVNELHGVWNPNKENRLVATIRFKENISHIMENNQ